MKSRFAYVIAIVGVALWSSAAASAQVTVAIDEVNSTVTLRPVIAGIVQICEGPLAPNGTCGPLGSTNFSDQLIFGSTTLGGPATFACLFSDGGEPDANCPPFVEGSNIIVTSIIETKAADGSETFSYTPSANQPGGGAGITYLITSDSAGESDNTNPTPEPASLTLLGSGILAVAGLIKRRLR